MAKKLVIANLVQDAINTIKMARDTICEHKDTVGTSGNPRAVNDLLAYCRNSADRPIKIKVFPGSCVNHTFKSAFVKFDDRYDIILMRDLNNCWKRFAMCKELCHFLLEDPSNCNPNLSSHVEDLFSLAVYTGESSGPNSTQLETIAEIAAMEYLFPYAERRKLTASQNKGVDCLAVAEKFLVPRDYVEKYLSRTNLESLGVMKY